ncbi:MAG TPA: TIGR04190 family B12-binding domain/radical SAM domain protein [Anaerolineae bacterium]|nr:TIGR04190 family B12-binding domain/radical SAM domain protein [Anaerolineae bacterium]HQH38878.1 TIGR04190 family B12-binding domain/radical SAM domain protein [Anaerolineae bacterium]
MYDLVFLHAPTVYDFRERATLWGPISDLVPSTPVFDMYPIGFATLLAHLQQKGFRVRMANLAARMVRSAHFKPEKLLESIEARAFGIDLHWLPHAHGALEVARLAKAYHPHAPVICGGYSATYFHAELVRYPWVDYVLRGDSTEEPLERLMEHILAGTTPVDVPNLTWKDPQGTIHVNPLTYVPENLDDLILDYHPLVKSVVRDRDLLNYAPFSHWLEYPIMAALTVKGCTQNCTICGGSAFAGRHLSGRQRPAYRSPEKLAEDVRRMGMLSRAPVFILGDLRQPGMDYARRFFKAVQGFRGAVIVEFFYPVERAYMEELAAALPNFLVEFSPDSHDPVVRRALGKEYTNRGIEDTIAACLEVGAQRFDLFFMMGLPQQTPESALQTVDYCRELLTRFDAGRLIPFISPLAPFLDPGSRAYEQADDFGYIRHAATLEDHRRLLLQPTWKHILSYETRWMDRDTLADVTYEAGFRLNRLKREVGLIGVEKAQETEARIAAARALMREIDEARAHLDEHALARALLALKPRIDAANTSTVCDKAELDVDVGWMPFKVLNLARVGLEG